MHDNEFHGLPEVTAPNGRDKVSRPVLRTVLATVSAVALTGCAATGGARPPASLAGLNATLWVQSSVEYRALARQAFAAATRALDRGLADSSWTAALEQTGDFDTLPPAVIVDVDETVLDNGDYQGRLLEDGESYAADTWAAWVAERSADAVPGAIRFTRAATRDGVTVFYVTNRDAPLEADTRANLARLDFPVPEGDEDVILTRGERPEWGSDKSSRRAHVARSYRILLLVGDDLGDFVEAGTDLAAREAALERHAELWGERWIVLPNPMYGSWERALLARSTDPDPVTAKLRHVETGREPETGSRPSAGEPDRGRGLRR